MTDRNGFISSFEFLLSLFMSHQWNVTHKKAQNSMIFKFHELFCLNIAYKIYVPITGRSTFESHRSNRTYNKGVAGEYNTRRKCKKTNT